MAVIIRCFESALSLVQAALPVSQAKLQRYVEKKREKGEKERAESGLCREFYRGRRKILAHFDRSYLANYSSGANFLAFDKSYNVTLDFITMFYYDNLITILYLALAGN